MIIMTCVQTQPETFNGVFDRDGCPDDDLELTEI